MSGLKTAIASHRLGNETPHEFEHDELVLEQQDRMRHVSLIPSSSTPGLVLADPP